MKLRSDNEKNVDELGKLVYYFHTDALEHRELLLLLSALKSLIRKIRLGK
jgi:hypothetical protein